MIDPRKVTNFERSNEELEEFLLFSIVVAGKGAFQQATKLEQFLTYGRVGGFGNTPFQVVRNLDGNGKLTEYLRLVKMGQYERISTAFRGVSYLFPGSIEITSLNLLECIKGIGMKTARFFAMHTRVNQQYACLDTHILKWLGMMGHEVPKSTPRGEKYLALEKVFLGYCEKYGKSPADMDLDIWNSQHVEKVAERI